MPITACGTPLALSCAARPPWPSLLDLPRNLPVFFVSVAISVALLVIYIAPTAGAYLPDLCIGDDINRRHIHRHCGDWWLHTSACINVNMKDVPLKFFARLNVGNLRQIGGLSTILDAYSRYDCHACYSLLSAKERRLWLLLSWLYALRRHLLLLLFKLLLIFHCLVFRLFIGVKTRTRHQGRI